MEREHYIDFKPYAGELAQIDPTQYGENLYLEGKTLCDETDLTYPFYSNNAKNEAFLLDFYKKTERGFYAAKAREDAVKYQKALAIFQANVPPINTRVWVEYPSDPFRFHEAVIVYLPQDKSAAVVKLASSDNQHGLQIIEYAYPGLYPTLHLTNPLA